MPRNTLKNLGFKLGRGWRLAENAFKGEALLIRKVDPVHWCVAKNKRITAVPTPHPKFAGGGSVIDHERERLIYLREQGVAYYDFKRKKEEVLIPLDTNLYRTRGLCLDSKKDALYYIREKYSPPWNVLLANLIKKKAAGMKIKRSLMTYSFKTGVSRALMNLGHDLSGSITDIRSGVFYANSKQEILIIDLHSGRVLKRVPSPNLGHICLAPDNKVLVWGLYSSAAYKLDPKGVKEASVFEGLATSFSGDGKHHSFWKRNVEFHVAGPRGKSECALISTRMFSDDVARFQPALWCPCNKHFALPLYIKVPPNGCYTALCVFNVEAKTATFCSRYVLDFNWL